MTRQKNPRRVLLPLLREAKKDMGAVIDYWDIAGTVYVIPADRKPGENATFRPRQRHEYPEYQPETWRACARRLDRLALTLMSLASWCRDQADEVTK